MKIEDAFAACEETVRRFDPDRYLASLFARAERRPLLHALYAFNYEIARLGEIVREPMLAEIRLQWWREAVEAACEGRPRAHPACVGLAELFARAGPPLELFTQLIDARAFDTSSDSFPDLGALEAYCDATSGNLMRIAALALDVDADVDVLAREAGTAYALSGILRAIPFQAARRKLYLPADLLAKEGVLPEDAFSGRAAPRLLAVVRPIAECARMHWNEARRFKMQRHVIAAALPAALVPLYLKRWKRSGDDPLVPTPDPGIHRRQLALLRAVLSRRV